MARRRRLGQLSSNRPGVAGATTSGRLSRAWRGAPPPSRLSAVVLALVPLTFACASVGPLASPRAQQSTTAASAAPAETASPAEDYDPSDPTKIEPRLGLGYKWTDYTRGARMNELRGKLALDLGQDGTFIADLGVGALEGFPVDDDPALTDGRFRYFKLWTMDRTVQSGYRGWGNSFEIQTQGNVPGTDGSNQIAIGAMWAMGWGKTLSVFPNLIASGFWSRNLDEYLGASARFDLICTYKPPHLWRGAYVKFKPTFMTGVSGDLSGEQGVLLEAALGGALNREKTWWLDVTGRWYSENEIDEVTIGRDALLVTDGSVFVSLTHFF